MVLQFKLAPVHLIVILIVGFVCQETLATVEDLQFLNPFGSTMRQRLYRDAKTLQLPRSWNRDMFQELLSHYNEELRSVAHCFTEAEVVQEYIISVEALTRLPVGQPASQNDINSWGTGFCDDSCMCGVPNRMTRIVGGSPTLANEYPWVASLSLFLRHICGATLITDRHVLTAAHCVVGNVYLLRLTGNVVLSRHRSRPLDPGAISKGISSIAIHPRFRPYTRQSLQGDISVILLSSAVEFNAKLSPACLPSPGENFFGYNATVVGWGRQGERRRSPDELLAVDIPIMSQDVCRIALNYETWIRNPRVTDDMMCAGVVDGGLDSCQGDSGGPLMITDHTNRTVIAGIVSWGEGCARPFRPGIYTRVNHYLSWVQQQTKDGCFCA